MATIGSAGPFNQVGFYPTTPMQSPAASAASFSPTLGGPSGLGYGRQMLGDIDSIMALIALLQQGASAPAGQTGMANNPASLGGIGAKGGGAPSLGKAGGKGGGSLARMGGKAADGAATLKRAGGK